MKIYMISFTGRGRELGCRLERTLSGEHEIHGTFKREYEGSLQEWTKEAFERGDGIIFIGAAGIAVRAIAGFVYSKTRDPAVLVMDEAGEYVIPLLSGHIGGANALAREISEKLGSRAVITTATDINEVFAVDVWAKSRGYEIENPENIKYISAALLEGKEAGFISDMQEEAESLFGGKIPEGIVVNDCSPEAGIVLSPLLKKPFKHTLNLVPVCLFLGCGSRKAAGEETLLELLRDNFKDKISIKAIAEIATLDIKKGEHSIDRLGEYLQREIYYYPAAALKGLEEYGEELAHSDFVEKTVGVDNVCERSALLCALDKGGYARGDVSLIIGKCKGEGVTLAVAAGGIKRDI